ncbi:ribonuclease H-like domain-containing protein [Tanacetum coccineum]
MAPRAVLMKTGLRPLNTARPVNTAHRKTTIYNAKPMSHFSKSSQSTVKRPYQIKTALTNQNFSQKLNTAKGKIYNAKPKAVNIARPNSVVVNAVRENQRTCPISETSRNLIEDMLPLGEEPKEEELLMCDKKNSVLFTDTGCFVLSPDFKLADEKFKNIVMSEFCKKKGIKREFSIARTPQQNDVAERRNRTLIDVLRYHLADSKLPTTFGPKCKYCLLCARIGDPEKKDDEGVSKKSGIDDQEKPKDSAQDVNTAGPIYTAHLKATHADFFGDETKLDMSNITTTYSVLSIPNTSDVRSS